MSGFRTVVIRSRAKLEVRLDNLIIRAERERRIFLGEISVLIIESTAVSLTAALVSELVKRNIKVIFCDEKYCPCAEIAPYYGSHCTSGRVREQVGWDVRTKGKVWRRIIERKIVSQSEHLRDKGFTEQAAMLERYASDVTDGDETNREGHAAKVYFNCILGDETRRGDGRINALLNYGYAVLLSAFAREIVASGYVTQMGIWHDNEYNRFNLASDLMEPYRTTVDRRALAIAADEPFKLKMAATLNCRTVHYGKETTLDVSVRMYVLDAMRALRENDASLLSFPDKIVWDDELL